MSLRSCAAVAFVAMLAGVAAGQGAGPGKRAKDASTGMGFGSLGGVGDIGGNGSDDLKQQVKERLGKIIGCAFGVGRQRLSVGFLVNKGGGVSGASTQPGRRPEGADCVVAAIGKWWLPPDERERGVNVVVEWGAGPLHGLQVDATDIDLDRKSVGTSEDAPTGSLPKEVVQRVIRRHLNEVRYCYEKELAKKPDLAGKILTQFTIDGRGGVSGALVIESSMNHETTEACITRRILSWEFPKPDGGGMVVVRYPFVFKASDFDSTRPHLRGGQ